MPHRNTLKDIGTQPARLYALRDLKSTKLCTHAHRHTHIYIGTQRSRNTVKDTARRAATLTHNHRDRHTPPVSTTSCTGKQAHSWPHCHGHNRPTCFCSHIDTIKHELTYLTLKFPFPELMWPLGSPGGHHSWRPHRQAKFTRHW